MSIPFTQYVLPYGRRKAVEFESSSPAIEALGQLFIAAGGRFEAEILSTGHVSLTAVGWQDGPNGPFESDLTCIICRNEEGFVRHATELLIAKAAMLRHKLRSKGVSHMKFKIRITAVIDAPVTELREELNIEPEDDIVSALQEHLREERGRKAPL
jgi:hypothetical protein